MYGDFNGWVEVKRDGNERVLCGFSNCNVNKNMF